MNNEGHFQQIGKLTKIHLCIGRFHHLDSFPVNANPCYAFCFALEFDSFTKTTIVKFLSLQPFVPSGSRYEEAKQFFQELGFSILWDADGYVGFQKDSCGFILQRFNNKEFAENFMLTVRVDSVDEFYKEITEKQLPQKFGIKVGKPSQQPYGREVNVIDMAGVCWHFVE